MFKSSPLVIAVLLNEVSAVKLGYRPTAGSVPWGGSATRPTWDTPDYPVNYFIPNFGVDHNILTTFNSLRIAEKGQKKELKASFAQSDAPADLRIPDLGKDEDVRNSLAAIDESQKETGKKIGGVNFGQQSVQYKPSTGMDADIVDATGSINFAEKKLNHQMVTQRDNTEQVSYAQKWQQLGMEDDVSMTQANIAESEKMYGKFVPVKDYDGLWRVGKEDQNVVQLDADIHLDSDPICSSSGCDQYKHEGKARGYDIDYPVPNLGMDRDIMGTLTNLPVAEKIVGHQWSDFGTDESKKKWSNPAKKVMYNFAPNLDGNIRDSIKNLSDTETKLSHKYELVQLNSDPICSSAGCGQYKHPDSKVATYPMDYGVPNFGMDRDVQGSFENLAVAEGIVKHHWAGIDKAKYSNPAKKVMYNFAPKLDGDIVDSQKNLGDTEKKLDHTYELA